MTRFVVDDFWRRCVRAGLLLSIVIALRGESQGGLPGTIDPNFHFKLSDVHALWPLPDGNILVSGRLDDPSGHTGRLYPNGEYDHSFDWGASTPGAVYSMVVHPDGQITVGGYFQQYEGQNRTALARVHADGTLDPAFRPTLAASGTDAPVVVSMGLQSDGNILIAGRFTAVNGVERTNLARLDPEGTLDSTFAPADKTPGIAQSTGVSQIAVQPDGRILVLEEYWSRPPPTRIGRLNPDGSRDDRFQPEHSGSVMGMALQPDGKIILTGQINWMGEEDQVLALRLESDGTVDPTFIPPQTVRQWTSRTLPLVLEDGKILVATDDPTGPVFRLNPDGTFDGNFEPQSTGHWSSILALAKDGAVLAGGAFEINGQPQALVRLWGGEPPATAPRFKTEPVQWVLSQGKAMALCPLVTAFPLPTYQWQHNGQDLSGATHSVLVLSNILTSAGSYQLRVSNDLGLAVSQAVVVGPPIILVQPAPLTVLPTLQAQFTVLATNALPISYQWQFDGQDILDQTNSTVVLTNVQPAQAGNYSVVVSNLLGAVTSVAAALTVPPMPAPQILAQPLSQTIDEGDEVWLSVGATNYLPVTYQWQLNSTNLPGATQPVLYLREVPLAGAGAYRVVVSSQYLSTTSEVAVLNITPLPVVSGVGYVSQKDQNSVAAVLAQTNYVRFGVNGYLTLTNTLVVTNHTTLDATGRKLTLDGADLVRHFIVTNGATLRLINLRLSHGRFVGAQGQTNQIGEAGLGGSIYVPNGNLELIACRFMSNRVMGGLGGPPGFWSFASSGGPACGGAICLVSGQLWASNCLFANDTSTGGAGNTDFFGYSGGGGESFGGAIYCTNGALTLLGVTFTNNLVDGGNVGPGRSGGWGGAAYGGAVAGMGTSMLISNCVFAANRISAGLNYAIGQNVPFTSADGGAIYQNGGDSTIESSLFNGNQAQGGPGGSWRSAYEPIGGPALGGAIFNQAGGLKVRNSALTRNQAQGGLAGGWPFGPSEGGAAFGGAIVNKGVLTLVNCTLAENQAQAGDAYGWWTRTPNKNGTAAGGAVYSSGQMSLLDVTLAGNALKSLPGRGVGSSIALTNSSAAMTNTILFCLPGQTNVSGSISDGGHNLCSDASAGFTHPTSRSQVDPLLAALADNGGPTPTLALLPGSPAIEAGDDAAAPPIDQRGVGRPCGSHSDIGAFELPVSEPLRIITPPQSMTLPLGETVSLFVAVNGLASVQWQHDGIDLPGATNSVLILSDVQLSQAGKYTVIATNAFGIASSTPVRLTVLPPAPPVIVQQPQSQAMSEGLTVSISVTATHLLPVKYQWQHNGTNVPGAIQPVLTLNPTQFENAGTYTVVISTKYASTVSESAILTVFPVTFPWVLTQPADLSVIEGGTTTLSVGARGNEPLAYQWLFDGIPLDGASASTLTLTNVSVTQAGTYTVSVNNSLGTVTSQGARLSVKPNLIDPTFSPLPALSTCSAIHLQRNGRILVATYPQKTMLRLTSNGSLDPSYDWAAPGQYWDSFTFAPDGGVVAWVWYNSQPPLGRWILVRFTPEGRVASEFVNNWIEGGDPLVFQPDGTLLACKPSPPALLLRAKPDGSQDPTFRVELGNDYVERLLVQPDGKLLVEVHDTNYQRILIRFDAQGIRETGFGIKLDWGDISKVVMQNDGKLLISGVFTNLNEVAITNLARLNPDGSVDPSFRPNPRLWIRDMVIDSTGRIYLAYAPPASGGLIRLAADGSVDPDFQVDIGTGTISSVADLGGGQLVIAGDFQQVNGAPRFGLAKLIIATPVPRIANWIRIGPMVRLSVPTLKGESYTLERSSNLGQTNWITIDTLLGDGANRVLVDHTATAEQTFYRVRTP